MNIITFANQKGGSGKTTGIQLTANILSQEPFNKRILVFDLDPQMSTYLSRQESLKIAGTNPKYDILALEIADSKKMIENLHKPFSFDEDFDENLNKDVCNTKITRVVSLPGQVDKIAKDQKLFLFKNNISFLDSYDIILIDLPGTLVSNQEIAGPLIFSDVVIVPFKPTDKDVASTLTFMDVLFSLRKVRQSKGLDQIIFSYINEHNRTTDYRKVKKLLDHFEKQDVLTSSINISNRKIYSSIDTTGSSIYLKALKENGGKNINQNAEIKKFTKELSQILDKMKNMKTTIDFVTNNN